MELNHSQRYAYSPMNPSHKNAATNGYRQNNNHRQHFQPNINNGSQQLIQLLIQLIQQLITALQNGDNEQPKPQQLDLSPEQLQNLNRANTIGLAFAGGNGPNITRVDDTNGDGVLSAGDTAHTRTLSFRSGSPDALGSFEIKQSLLDVDARLQAQIPALTLNTQQFQALTDLAGGARHTFDNDGNGVLSVGDEIVTRDGSLRTVDTTLLQQYNEAITTDPQLDIQNIDRTRLTNALGFGVDIGITQIIDVNNDGELSVGDFVFVRPLNTPPGLVPQEGRVTISEATIQDYLALLNGQ